MPLEVRLVFSGFEVGNHVYSGGALASCAPEDSPCRRAYGDVVGEGKESVCKCALGYAGDDCGRSACADNTDTSPGGCHGRGSGTH